MSKDDFVSKDVERINNLFESSDEMRAFSNEHEKELQVIFLFVVFIVVQTDLYLYYRQLELCN